MDKEKYIKPIKNLLYIIAILWIVHILSYFFPINRFGIIPREISGLWGILFAPLLHQDFPHLAANSASLFVLGLFLITLEHGKSFWIIAALIIVGGFGTWIIGRPGTIHIGASGVIYGIFGYLVTRGLFRRDFKSIIISIVVFIFYCGMIFGVLPADSGQSWESHLCGFLSGILLAASYGRK